MFAERRYKPVTFQKTLSINDWYHDGGDGFPLGAMQLIGKVQGVMMKSAAPRLVPLPVLNQLARRGVEWLIMAEDLPTPDSRVTVDGAGRIDPPHASPGARARIASCSSVRSDCCGPRATTAAMNPALTIAAQALRAVAESDLAA